MGAREEFEKVWPHIQKLQSIAEGYGIPDIFQDNGGKVLQVAMRAGLEVLQKRMGNDAKDESGREFELKTVNVSKRYNGFTTHHHLNDRILGKYRKASWIFGVFEGIELKALYRLEPEKLESYFGAWEKKLEEKREGKPRVSAANVDGDDVHLNNPKIRLKFVEEEGELIYGCRVERSNKKRVVKSQSKKSKDLRGVE